MPRRRGSEVIREDEVGVYHVWVRCVRRAWLCGLDPLTGNDYQHRKGWIESRLAELARIFAIDACVDAVLSNHYHRLLRNRPDLVLQWSDEEVARRWWQLCPQRCHEDGSPADPSPFELRCRTSDAKRIATWRGRLSSISWLLQYLNQWLAKRANKEDDVRGHFIEGRFECRSLLDEGAVLAARTNRGHAPFAGDTGWMRNSRAVGQLGGLVRPLLEPSSWSRSGIRGE